MWLKHSNLTCQTSFKLGLRWKKPRLKTRQRKGTTLWILWSF
nr:MAG TPA: hypothetical protein [Caudoviricetes sp.]